MNLKIHPISPFQYLVGQNDPQVSSTYQTGMIWIDRFTSNSELGDDKETRGASHSAPFHCSLVYCTLWAYSFLVLVLSLNDSAGC